MKRLVFSNTMDFLSTSARISICLLLLIGLVSIPDLCFAAQGNAPDSVSVLAITHHGFISTPSGDKMRTDEIKKVSYISKGAIVNLSLKDGRTLNQVQVEEVGNNHLLVAGESVPLSSIQQIEVGTNGQRSGTKILGTIVLVIGLICAAAIIAAAIGFEVAGFLALLLFWIPGYLWVNALLRKFPRFKLRKSPLSLGTVPLSSLSTKIQRRLSRKSRFYFNRLK